jgi:hypothetical protein
VWIYDGNRGQWTAFTGACDAGMIHALLPDYQTMIVLSMRPAPPPP